VWHKRNQGVWTGTDSAPSRLTSWDDNLYTLALVTNQFRTYTEFQPQLHVCMGTILWEFSILNRIRIKKKQLAPEARYSCILNRLQCKSFNCKGLCIWRKRKMISPFSTLYNRLWQSNNRFWKEENDLNTIFPIYWIAPCCYTGSHRI
jgi:hypothetical protein